MKKFELLFLTVVFGLLMLLIIDLQQYVFEVKLLPLLIIVPVALLVIIQVLRGILTKDKQTNSFGEEEAGEKIEPGMARKHISALGYLAALLMGAYLFGFMAGFSLFTLFFTKLRGESWLLSISLAIAMPALIWLGFGLGLDVSFYRGIVFLKMLS